MRLHGLRRWLFAVNLLTLGAGLGILVATGNVLLASTVANDNRQRLAARLDAEVAALSAQGVHVRVRPTLNDAGLDVYACTMLAIVRDDGPGVDPALGETIFLPGVRGPDEGGDGAGLGLPLAQRLAHSCGGEIQLGEGPGGCFVIVLPVAAGVTGEPNTSAPTLPGTR